MTTEPAYRVTALRMGTLDIDASNLLDSAEPGSRMEVPVWAALIEGRGRRIVVDTGIREPDWVLRRLENPCRQGPSETMPGALAQVGVQPADVDTVINTHLHFDHSGYNEAFAGATFYVSRVEWMEAAEPGAEQAVFYERRDWLDGGLEERDYRLIDDDPFTLADGIQVIQTPGHSIGHQSVLVETAEGVVCIAGDAVASVEGLAGGEPPGIVVSRQLATASVGRIARSCDRIMLGHDMVLPQFATSFPAVPAAV